MELIGSGEKKIKAVTDQGQNGYERVLTRFSMRTIGHLLLDGGEARSNREDDIRLASKSSAACDDLK